MRVSITYLYAISRFGYPPEPGDDFKALKEIRKMGFRFVELEGLGASHTEGIWSHRVDLRKCIDDLGMHVHNFCSVDPHLVSLDRRLRRQAYDRFRRSSELGVSLGAETLHLASYAPPIRYEGGAPYRLGTPYSFHPSTSAAIPPGFSWERVWDVLVKSCRFAATVAAEHRRTVIMEPRVGELVGSVDSLLRLIADVAMKNFKANFDTGHFSAQRENVPLALMKLEGQFANVHVSDNNPRDASHLPLGKGLIDWHEFFRVLKVLNYRGYLGMDFPGSRRRSDYMQSLEYMRGILGKLRVPVEW